MPGPCEPLHKLYDRAFDLSSRRLGLLAAFLVEADKHRKGTLASEQVAQALQTTRADLAELAAQAEALDEEIRQAKIELALRFPEVQVPEADPPAVAPSP